MSEKEHPKEKEHKEHIAKSVDKAAVKAAITWTLVAAGIFAVVVGLGALAFFGYDRLYSNRIFPGVRVLGVRMDGLTADEARTTLHASIDSALTNGVRFSYAGREVALGSATVAQDPDLSRDYVTYNVDDAVNAAMGVGRSGNPIRDTLARWIARAKPIQLAVATNIDTDGIKSAVMKSLGNDISPAQDARIIVHWDAAAQDARVDVQDAKSGKSIVWDGAMEALRRQAATLKFAPIPLRDTVTQPTLLSKDVEPLKNDAEALLARAPITLTYVDKVYPISKEQFAGWVNVVKTNGKLSATIDPDIFAKQIREIAPIEVRAQKGTLEVKDGKITNFTAGSVGISIDDAATLKGITDGIFTTSTFPIIANKVDASLDGSDPEKLGIKEIIGIGTSDFSGSPTNRRKNIANGVSKVNGTIIAPGEEFSLLKTLGSITADQGWYPELVIKGNETTPELGGGLCQIGTTAFRAALNSGMKITERRNHSYRVRYYEPAGTDATIYDPSPDFKFVNDTKTSILINAYIKGDIITYEFWGTKDGRKVTVGPSQISNITPPPPKKTIETLSLKPGQTKCTETAHAGADAALPYHIDYADGTVHDEVFHSHYRPWQAVCLVGVEKLSDPAAGAASSTTP